LHNLKNSLYTFFLQRTKFRISIDGFQVARERKQPPHPETLGQVGDHAQVTVSGKRIRVQKRTAETLNGAVRQQRIRITTKLKNTRTQHDHAENVQFAETANEAGKLVEADLEYVCTTPESYMLFNKRK
jgi:hypothetical protein